MVVQKRKKKKRNCQQTFLAFLNASPKIHLINKSLNSLDSFRSCAKLLEKKKKRELYGTISVENDFQTSSSKVFPKKHPDFGDLETSLRHEIQT